MVSALYQRKHFNSENCKMKIQVTYEIFDEWIRGYATGELITNHFKEFEELKQKYHKQLLQMYEII